MTILQWILAILGFLIALSGVLAIIYDVVAMYTKWPTISWMSKEFCRKHPLIPALVGLIVGLTIGLIFGHLFWPITSE